jgi:hypothetical protein
MSSESDLYLLLNTKLLWVINLKIYLIQYFVCRGRKYSSLFFFTICPYCKLQHNCLIHSSILSSLQKNKRRVVLVFCYCFTCHLLSLDLVRKNYLLLYLLVNPAQILCRRSKLWQYMLLKNQH